MLRWGIVAVVWFAGYVTGYAVAVASCEAELRGKPFRE